MYVFKDTIFSAIGEIQKFGFYMFFVKMLELKCEK